MKKNILIAASAIAVAGCAALAYATVKKLLDHDCCDCCCDDDDCCDCCNTETTKCASEPAEAAETPLEKTEKDTPVTNNAPVEEIEKVVDDTQETEIKVD